MGCSSPPPGWRRRPRRSRCTSSGTGSPPAQLFEVRTAIELAVLDRVLEHPDPEIVARLRDALTAEQSATRVGVRGRRPRPARRARRAVRESCAAVAHPGARAIVAAARRRRRTTRSTRCPPPTSTGSTRGSSRRSSTATGSWRAIAPSAISRSWNAGSVERPRGAASTWRANGVVRRRDDRRSDRRRSAGVPRRTDRVRAGRRRRHRPHAAGARRAHRRHGAAAADARRRAG